MDHSPALTRLEQALLLLAVLAVAGIALNLFTGDGAGNPAGIVPRSLAWSSEALFVDDPLLGYQDPDDPGRIGSVSLSLRLFPGAVGALDMAGAGVVFTTPEGSETCGVGTVPPNWTVTDRLNVPPFGTADDDDLLEPGEEFVLRVWPSRPLAPGETFALTIDPEEARAVTTTRTVPVRITPVTDLG